MTIKTYFRLFVLALIIGLSAWAIIATNRAAKYREESNLLEQNLIASSFEVKELKTKLDELLALAAALLVTPNDLYLPKYIDPLKQIKHTLKGI